MKIVALLVLFAACAHGQETCGINSDCVCRDRGKCLASERESSIDSCSRDSDVCCCPNTKCGVFLDCSCRESCLPNERSGQVTNCVDAQPPNMLCCCQNNLWREMLA